MFSYKEFPTQILRAFMPITEKYNLIVSEIREDHKVVLCNEHIKLSLICDHGYLDFYVNIDQNTKDFWLNDLLSFYSSGSQLRLEFPYTGCQYSADWYAEKCDELLGPALNGDRSWIRPITERKKYQFSIWRFKYEYKKNWEV